MGRQKLALGRPLFDLAAAVGAIQTSPKPRVSATGLGDFVSKCRVSGRTRTPEERRSRDLRSINTMETAKSTR